jgi:hypothetical protein
MPTVPSVFLLWRIALTAVIAAGVGFVVLRWRFKELPIPDGARRARRGPIRARVAPVSECPQFNDDPIALFSPNDWLCPMITYVCLGLYTVFYPPTDPVRWPQARALLTIVAFVVNVLVI